MWEILFSTHHTDIGLLYIITSMTFLFMGGVLALSIRSELFLPNSHFLGMGPNDFERIFTVHGTDMLLLWVIPFAAGVGNYLIPIYVRYKDMAWPKLNADDSGCCYFNLAGLLRHRLDCISTVFHYKSSWSCNR